MKYKYYINPTNNLYYRKPSVLRASGMWWQYYTDNKWHVSYGVPNRVEPYMIPITEEEVFIELI